MVNKKDVQITVKFSEKTANKLTQYAEKKDIGISTAIREIVSEKLV